MKFSLIFFLLGIIEDSAEVMAESFKSFFYGAGQKANVNESDFS